MRENPYRSFHFAAAMFRPENRRETVGMLVGFAVLALGVVLLLLAFSIASGIASHPGDYLQSQIPKSAPEPKGPRASFRWTATGFSVAFNDSSTAGNATLVDRTWDFGDGASSVAANPSHTYARNGSYFVRLTVRDGNQKESSAISDVAVFPGNQASGNSTSDVGDVLGSINPLAIFGPLVNIAVGVAAVVVTFFMLLIMVLVGSAITKAGWNLARPRPETIRVRVKPKHLEVEPIQPPAAPPPT